MNTENLDLGWRLRDGRMSEMTREEAIKWLEEAVNDTNNDFDLCSEALKKSCCFKRMYLKWQFLRLRIRMVNGSA